MQNIQDIIWGLQSDFVQKNDSYQENDLQGRGIFQRYLELFASELDTHLIPKIANLGVYTHSPTEILDTIVPIREASLGLYSPFYVDMDLRKKTLQYLPIVMRMRGTLQNYIFLLGLLGFDVAIDEDIQTGAWDSGTWDSSTWDSYANINGTFQLILAKRYSFVVTPELEAQIQYIVEWNCPIHCECSYVILGVVPAIDVQPEALDFGSIIVGQTATLQFTISNTGEEDLIVSSITLPFGVYSVDWSSGTIAGMASQVVNLTLAPTLVGGYSGTLTVNSNAFAGNNEIELTATAVAVTRIIDVSPTTLAFGTVEIGETNTLSFTISNTGNSALNVTSLSFPFATYTADWNSGAIESGGSQLVNVTYTPTANTTENGNITVNSDATSGVNTVEVTATGFLEIGTAFNGVSNYLRSQSNVPTPSHLSPFTYSFKIRTGNTFPLTQRLQVQEVINEGHIIEILQSTGGALLQITKQTGASTQQIRANVLSVVSNTVYTVHFTSSGDANSMNMYINGVLQPKMIITNNTLADVSYSSKRLFGTRDGALQFFNGVLYWARSYNKVLSPSEILDEHNTGFVPATAVANQLHCWELQDAQNTATRVASVGGVDLDLLGYTPGEIASAQRDLNNNPI